LVALIFDRLRLILVTAFACMLFLWLLSVFFVFSNRALSFVTFFILCLALFAILFCLLAGLRWILKPLFVLASKAEQTLATTSNISTKPSRRRHEIEFVAETFNSLLAELNAERENLRRLQNLLNERAASAEAFSQQVVNNLPTGLLAFDAKGELQILNQPAAEIFDLPSDAAENQTHFRDLFQNAEDLIQIINQSLSENKKFPRLEIRYQTRNKVKQIGLTISPFEFENLPAGVLCLAADITEILELREQALIQQNLESLGIMSAGLAHELKNALAALDGYAQFLRRAAVSNPKLREAACELSAELQKFSEMISAFLNFAKPQKIHFNEIDLSELVQECVAEMKNLTSNHKAKIRLDGCFGKCLGDKILLRQVFLNLLRNAFEAASLNAKACVCIKGSQNKDENGYVWETIAFSDNGGGIPKEDLPFVFIPFFTTKQTGHGIGLALSHRIISQHGGFLLVANHFDGAVFTVKLKSSAVY
jgi:signal transduction histidine kinase